MASCCQIQASLFSDENCDSHANGGNRKIYAFDKRKVSYTLDSEGNVSAISFCESDYDCLFVVDAIEDTIGYTAVTTNNPFGASTVHTVNGKLQIGSQETYEELLRYLAIKKNIGLIVQDNNGRYYISGLQSGFRLLTINDISGLVATDEKSVELTFEGNEPRTKRFLLAGNVGDSLEVRLAATDDLIASLLCDATDDCGCPN